MGPPGTLSRVSKELRSDEAMEGSVSVTRTGVVPVTLVREDWREDVCVNAHRARLRIKALAICFFGDGIVIMTAYNTLLSAVAGRNEENEKKKNSCTLVIIPMLKGIFSVAILEVLQ